MTSQAARLGTGLAIAACALGLAVGHPVDRAQRTAGAALPASVLPLRSCGRIPVGEDRDVIAQLSADPLATSGRLLPSTLYLSPRGGGPADYSAAEVDVLAVRDGRIVGSSQELPGSSRSTHLTGATRDYPAVLSQQSRLLACGGAPERSATAASPRAALPPGTYQLVGVVHLGSRLVVSDATSVTLTPATVAGPHGTRLPVCGLPPAVADGAVTGRVGARGLVGRILVHGPLISGDTIQPSVSIAPISGSQDVSTGSPRNVVLLREGQVVGQWLGGIAGVGVGASNVTSAHPLVVRALSLLLSGCPPEPVDPIHPDRGRQPLPPGNYQLATDDNEDVRAGPLTVTVVARPSSGG